MSIAIIIIVCLPLIVGALIVTGAYLRWHVAKLHRRGWDGE